ncbi:MAG: sigma 54-interacting transcriptional regulator [Magnetococcales bacterium]|nr:sigma 54-interacting transcriptional regulator [Magnetococcales bacterium]
MKATILVVEDERKMQQLFARILSNQGHTVSCADDYETALLTLENSRFDLVLSDIILGKQTGLDLLKAAQEREFSAYFIMVTGNPSLESAQKAIRYGAFDFITKPVLKEALLRTIEQALKHKALQDEKSKLRANLTAIFNSVDDAIITVDEAVTLIEVNHAASALCQLAQSEVGHPFTTHDSHCQGQCMTVVRQALARREKIVHQHIVCHCSSRPEQVVKVTASPLLRGAGEFSGAVMIVADQTQLATMEKALNARRQFHRLIGQSQPMQDVFNLIEDLANVETTVLITGQSGTGKELVAEAIHNQGSRKNKPLICVNCAALSDNLLESELFGHVKGAFTGALKDRIGRFQLADKGTLFLDEIGDISTHLQVRLLRVLQEKQFERVGEATTISVDVRVIAATNQNLKQRIAQGKFREDLYYRLNVVELHIPALKNRSDDIPLLVDHFIQHFNNKYDREISTLSQEAIQTIMNHTWPGNVRELEHALEHAFVVCHDSVIESHHLPSFFLSSLEPTETAVQTSTPVISEKEAIRNALQQTYWRRQDAAKLLGMARSTFFRKMKKYGITNKQ